MIGVGAMIAELSGNDESAKAFSEAIGKTIKRVWLADDALKFTFEDGTNLELMDDGQSCCESRYMVTDDKLEDYAGATLISGVLKEGPDMPAEYDSHETQFLEIQTSKGAFTMTSHVEHNGYYGGFAIRARKVT